jgi:hypothetical protein
LILAPGVYNGEGLMSKTFRANTPSKRLTHKPAKL